MTAGWGPLDDEPLPRDFIAWVDEHLSHTTGEAFELTPAQRRMIESMRADGPSATGHRRRKRPPVAAELPRAAQPAYVIHDELGSTVPRRELIVVRPDGSTYGANVPADTDLGELLAPGEVVGFDGGATR